MSMCACTGRCRQGPYFTCSGGPQQAITNFNNLDLQQQNQLNEWWNKDPAKKPLVGSDEWLRRGREMTRDDLGLPPPYAFWLGAEG
jgi:hypothetical protein